MPKKTRNNRRERQRRISQLTAIRARFTAIGEDVQIEDHHNQREIFNLLWAADFMLAQVEGLL